jgi:hypothetical protein
MAKFHRRVPSDDVLRHHSIGSKQHQGVQLSLVDMGRGFHVAIMALFFSDRFLN